MNKTHQGLLRNLSIKQQTPPPHISVMFEFLELMWLRSPLQNLNNMQTQYYVAPGFYVSFFPFKGVKRLESSQSSAFQTFSSHGIRWYDSRSLKSNSKCMRIGMLVTETFKWKSKEEMNWYENTLRCIMCIKNDPFSIFLDYTQIDKRERWEDKKMRGYRLQLFSLKTKHVHTN